MQINDCVYLCVLLVGQLCLMCVCLYVCVQMAGQLQLYVCGLTKSLVRTERNQQIMCEACLPHELLSRATVTLEMETHFLHRLIQYIFERLAAQSLTPKDLRYVLAPSVSRT